MLSLPKELLLTITSYLSSFDIEKLYFTPYLKSFLQDEVKIKSIKELKKTLYSKPWYPMNIKQHICDLEHANYENIEKVMVDFNNKIIGYAKFRKMDGTIMPSFWCGYCRFPKDFFGDEDIYDFFDKVGFNEELTAMWNEEDCIYVGWDHMHYTNMNLEGYQTLEATIDQVICCYRKAMDYKKLPY
jgi:hypothetical protein